MKRPFLLLASTLLLCLGVLAPAACSMKRGARGAPVPADAASSLADARRRVRAQSAWSEPLRERELAREAARRAAELAPDWIAPLRFQDDLARERLLGPEALAERFAALTDGASAEELYLAGRLQGRSGLPDLVRAAALDPTLSWAQHGLAWSRFLMGNVRGAVQAGERAVELARGSHELGFFSTSVARYLLELDRAEEAKKRLTQLLEDPRLEEPERREVEVWLARAELECDEEETIERGFWRAVGLLEQGGLTVEEVDRLGDDLLARRARASVPDALSVLEGALGPHPDGASANLRGRILLEQGALGLAAGLLAGRRDGASAFERARLLERGDARGALDAWCNALPARLRDAEGLPHLAALRELVLAARRDDALTGPEFGQALLAAGWFREAESWSSALATRDPEAALALHAHAAEGRALLAGIRALLDRVDEERAVTVPGRSGELPPAHEVETLDQLLLDLQSLFERYHGHPLEQDLTQSPRLGQAHLAEVVHPGPTFSAEDEREGRGTRGAPVGGLAHELLEIGRFGIFGQAPGGGGPDGTVLRLVGTEWKSGTHLGVPFAGLVAWCEGTDVPSRPGRAGSPVSGAALHEGFWVDIEGVRHDLERVLATEKDYLADDPAGLEHILSQRGPRVLGGGGASACARWMEPLGEGERVLLAVLRERAAAGRPAEARVSLDELLDLTALHEEGHLTDRTRFLPLSKKWPQALAFGLRHGFSPRGIAGALEVRAELVALCEAEEPRLALADCLSAAGEGGVLPHGEAFQELLEGLLALAAHDLTRYPALDSGHYLLYQLHFLSGEEVRALALALARREGLVEE